MCWKNEKGFFLLELLLSLSAWFMLCLFLLPVLIEIKGQIEQEEINRTAEQLMYEELQAQLLGKQSYTGYSVFESGIEFKVLWRDSVLNGDKEVCVKVEHTSFNNKTEKCGLQE